MPTASVIMFTCAAPAPLVGSGGRSMSGLSEPPHDVLQLALGQTAPSRIPRPLLGTFEIGKPCPLLSLGHP